MHGKLQVLRYYLLGFGGTFAPFLRASERAMAMACFGLVTFLLLRPLLSLPTCISRISVSTCFPAAGLYLRPDDFFDAVFAVDFLDAVFLDAVFFDAGFFGAVFALAVFLPAAFFVGAFFAGAFFAGAFFADDFFAVDFFAAFLIAFFVAMMCCLRRVGGGGGGARCISCGAVQESEMVR
jgi:hypothetical protein